jgi:subtilisin
MQRQGSRFFIGAWVGLLLLILVGRATAGVVPDALYDIAAKRGAVRVIVQLRAAARPEGQLESAQAVTAQRQHLAAHRAALLAEVAARPHRLLRAFETIPFVAMEVSPETLAVLEASPHVVAVEEDRIESASLSQSVPLIGADQAWASGFDGAGVTVVVLDSGVDKTHPFLAGKVVEEACFSGNRNCPNGQTSQLGPGAGVPCTYAPDGCRHGTHVAGIAAGAGASFSGVAKAATIMAVQVFSRFTGSECTGDSEDPCTKTFVSDQIAGLERVFALRNHYTFAAVTMSLGSGKFTAPCDSQEAARKAAMDNLRSVGIATVAAAGNEAFTNALSTPACISAAVSVGSTTKSDGVSIFSNSASFLSLLAPGSSITSSVPGGGFAVFSGTSMATPHVAGAWAILKQKRPSATVDEVLAALKGTGVPITDPRNNVTTPRIRVDAALQALPQPLASGVPVNGSVAKDHFDYYSLVVQAGATQLTVNTTNAIADVDLYVRFRQLPSDSVFDCGSFGPTGSESCTIANPAAGIWYVGVNGFAEGTHSYTLTATVQLSPLAFVTRLYQQVLGRGPDPAGLQGFVAQLQQFGSVVPTVLAFFNSQEFLSRNTSNDQFLTILYRTFLNREPDQAGFSTFLADLDAGRLTRNNLLDLFIDSPEFATQASFLPPQNPVTAFVTTLYVGILGRGPDPAGLQGFVAQLQQTRTVLPTVQLFLASAEFQGRNTTNTEFVTLLYRVFLRRVPDPAGLAGWVLALSQGATREQLVAQFAASAEFQAIQRTLFP